MGWNGSGTFNYTTAGTPVVTSTVISSVMFNAMLLEGAVGLSTCIAKDGQTATSARIPFALGINSTLATDATNTTTGSILAAGGVGIVKALWVGGLANIAGALTVAGFINKLTLTAPATSAVLTIADGKTLTVSNTLTLAGTDGKGISIGAATSGAILRGDGTNMALSAFTLAAPSTSGNILTSNGTNWLSAAPAAAGVTSITGTANQVIADVSTGAVTLSLPQSIGTASDVSFATLKTSGVGIIGGASVVNSGRLTVEGSGASSNLLVINDTTNQSGTVYAQFFSNSVLSGQIARVAQTGAVVYTTTSDERLKNILGNSRMEPAAQRLLSVLVRDFEWKSTPGKVYTGFIAQEVHRTHPDSVIVGGEDTVKKPWGVDRSGLIPDLVLGWKYHEERLLKLERLSAKG